MKSLLKILNVVALILILLSLTGCQFLKPFERSSGENLPDSQPYINQNNSVGDGELNDQSYPSEESEPEYGIPGSPAEAGSIGSQNLSPQSTATMPRVQSPKGEAASEDSGQWHPVEPPVEPIEVPNDMFFEDYGVNPFVHTDEDHLSTFSTDVDTGSYTIARSYINQGLLPPQDAVRVEEFVNFFPQGYPMPSERETFNIQIDGGPSPFAETDGHKIIRVGIQGYDVSERERKDAALTFVIDVSGSMGNGHRLEMVQDSLELLVDQLKPSDSVGIIAYTDTAWVVLEHTSARNKRLIIDAIYSLYPMASTNAEAGLILGYQEASQAYIPGGINRVILCSDGVANVGNTGPESIMESIREYASEGITMTSIGVGMGNYNDVLMEQLADQGNGFYAYIDTMEEAHRLFTHDLTSTLQVIAYDAKVQVDFNPDVVSYYRLIGFENRAIADEDFRDNTVDAAEIGAGHTVTALYEVKLYNNTRGEIATVQFRWKDAETYRVKEIAESFYTQNLASSFRRSDPYFQMDVLVAEFAEILRNSYWAENSSLWDVLEYAESIADRVERNEFYEFIELLEQALYL